MPPLSRILLLLATAAPAADWPEFRGPDGQGHSSARHVPIEWSSSKNVAWKKPLPGLAWSSPVLHGGRIYLTTAVSAAAKSLSLRAICLDADTGEIVWNA